MNIYDIAREAGVSIATVSRVLNHKDTVRADTRAKVERVLKRCNYAPSAIAQGMVSKSLHTVAVLTVDIRDSHYARTAYTIEREFGRRGYEVILCNTGGDRAETLRTLQAVAQKQVDGLILLGAYLYGEYPSADTLTVYGSLNQSVEDKIDYTKHVVEIDGGNHAQFGSYGLQRGDPPAEITPQEQQARTVEAISDFLAQRQER